MSSSARSWRFSVILKKNRSGAPNPGDIISYSRAPSSESARHTDAVAIHYRRPTDRRRRPQRWRDAVAELIALQREYPQWLAALPEAIRDGATGDALQTILDLDLDEIAAVATSGFGR